VDNFFNQTQAFRGLCRTSDFVIVQGQSASRRMEPERPPAGGREDFNVTQCHAKRFPRSDNDEMRQKHGFAKPSFRYSNPSKVNNQLKVVG